MAERSSNIMQYRVVDNFLPYSDFCEIRDALLSPNFPWFYGVVVEDDAIIEDIFATQYNFQFTHLFYTKDNANSQHFYNLKKLIDKIDPISLVRIKANLSPKTDKIIEYGYHTDFENIISCVFYINSNNGYTKFKNGTTIESVENRALFFDSNLLHTGTSCTDQNIRIAINLNFVPRKV